MSTPIQLWTSHRQVCQVFHSMDIIQCSHCGADVPQSDAYYADDGGQVCPGCFHAEEVSSSFLNSYKGGAVGALAVACLSLCFNPLCLVALVAFCGAIATLRFEKHLDLEEKQLIRSHSLPKVLGGFALALSIISASLWLLQEAVWLKDVF